MPGPVFAVEGPSGAGKSSVSRALAKRLGATCTEEALVRLGPGVSLEFRGGTELAALERSLLQEDGRRYDDAEKTRESGAPVVLDTATFGTLTYSWGWRESDPGVPDVVGGLVREARRLLEDGHWGIPDLTLYLDVPEAVAAERAASDPVGHPAWLAARHRVVGRYERLLYSWELPRRLPGRFFTAAAEGSPHEVALGLADRIERMGPPPRATRAEAIRLLELFEGSGPLGGAAELRRRDPNS